MGTELTDTGRGGTKKTSPLREELSALREEAESLSEALAARKAIERAKGLLMEREGLTEQDAFARLRKASQISGRPLKVVAEALYKRSPGGTWTTLATTAAGPKVAAGDQIGLKMVGTTITMWQKPAAGTWAQVGSVRKSVYAV